MATPNQSRHKKKNKQTLYAEKPNDDAVYCQECKGWVDCSLGGAKNMVNHDKSNAHKANFARNHPTQVTGPMDRFAFKKTAAQPNASGAPALVHNSVLEGPSAPRAAVEGASSGAAITDNPLSADAMLALSVIQMLRSACLRLNADVPIGTPEDRLAVFAYPAADPDYDDQCEFVGRTLHSVFSYELGHEGFCALVRRGEYGLDGFCAWLEFFVRHHQLGSGIVSAKVESLLKAVESLSTSAIDSPRAVADDGFPTFPALMPLSDSAVFEDTLATLQSPKSAPVFPADPLLEFYRCPCPGFRVPIPPGQSPHRAYNFAMHGYSALPWSYRSAGNDLLLFSHHCTSYSASFSDSTPCDACRALSTIPRLQNHILRMEHGVQEHTPHQHMSHDQLVELLDRKSSLLERMRFQLLAAGQKLATVARANDRSRRILQFIAEGKVQRASTVLSNAFNRGYGLLGVLNLLSDAAKGLYHAKSYTEAEFRKGFILLRFGGARTADFGYRALGMPSPRSIRRHMPAAVLEASPGMPTKEELSRNLSTALSASSSAFSSRTYGFTLMMDEIALEKRLRWDPASNMILGVCREHGQACALEFRTGDEAKGLFRALESDKVHLASEASVLAVGAFAAEPRLYQSRPFGLSGSCKAETAQGQEILLRTALEACQSQRTALGRCYCIASDGAAHRRQAMAAITMCASLSPSSPIYSQLAPLPFMNLWCGDDDLTCDIDFKHVAKRLRNTLLRKAGSTINGVTVRALSLRAHLLDSGMPMSTTDALLNPDDEQDVVLMYRLLAAVLHLPKAPSKPDPISSQVRRVLWLLGQLFSFILGAYTDTSLSLREQLEHLAAAAFIVFQLYRQDRTSFIPSQLYMDIMIMVKNVYFCVAKAKVDNPSGEFWIILLGTDRLESNFGVSRTTVGSDSNADLYQLATRFLAIVQIALILAEHPEWDRGPRRLHLPPNVLALRDVQVDKRLDHITPAIWTGDLHVADVILLTCWNHGRELAETTLASANVPVTYDKLDSSAGFDIFCPFGESIMKDFGPDSRDDSLSCDTASSAPAGETPDGRRAGASDAPASTNSSTPNGDSLSAHDAAMADHLSISCDDVEEDLMTEVVDASFERQEITFCSTVLIDGETCHKGRILRLWSESREAPGSTDRIDRIIGKSRYRSHRLALGLPPDDEASLEIDDPVAALLRCDADRFLAIARVAALAVSGKSVPSVSVSNLQEPGVRVTLQILILKQRFGEKDWVWTGDLDSRHTLPTVDGRHVQVISPTMETCDGSLAFAFSTEELRLLAGELFGRTRKVLHHLTEVAATENFPYRTAGGSACFAAQSDHPDQDMENARERCSRCPSSRALMDEDDMRVIREHMGGHILHDPTFATEPEPCGLCLSTDNSCQMHIKKGRGKGAFVLDMDKSRCPNLFKRFSLKPASESKAHSPCSNVPLICPLCGISSRAVWRYSLREHLTRAHGISLQGTEKWRQIWYVEDDERDRMRVIYRSKPKRSSKAKSKSKKRKLRISASYSSLMAMRNESAGDEQATDAPSAKRRRVDDGSSQTVAAVHIPHSVDNSVAADSSGDSESDNGGSSDSESHHSFGDDDWAMSADENTMQLDQGRIVAYNSGNTLMSVESPAEPSALALNAPEPSTPTAMILSNASGPSSASASALDMAETRPRRSVRARTGKVLANGAGICFCDAPKRGEEISCTKAGCETVLFHRSCVLVKPDEPVARWKCPACLAT